MMSPQSFCCFITDGTGDSEFRWYAGPVEALDEYVSGTLIFGPLMSGLFRENDEAIVEVARIHSRATAAGQGLDEVAAALNAVMHEWANLTWWGSFRALCEDDSAFPSGLRESWRDMADDEETDDSAAADRPISADEMEGFVAFLAEYGV